MKTEQEIRARIATRMETLKAQMQEEADNGHEGNDDWFECATRLHELKIILGEE